MASFDRSIAPRTDSSASMLWGGTRPPPPEGRDGSGRMLLIDCTTRARLSHSQASPSPARPRGASSRLTLVGRKGHNPVDLSGSYPHPGDADLNMNPNVCSIM